jgi:hypothetical protein
MFSKNFLFYLIVILFSACSDDETTFPVEPSISFVSISPSSALEFSDDVVVTLRYEDGDGDLGENVDSVKNCFVTDNRIGVTYEFRINQLSPSGAIVPITGNVKIHLHGQSITDNSTQQNVSYTLYVVDRAGHRSNSITTSSIVIRK